MEYVDSGRRGEYSHIVMSTMATDGAPLVWCNARVPGWPLVNVTIAPAKPICPRCIKVRNEHADT